MATKRTPLAFALVLFLCAAVVYVMGSLRPFAANEKFAKPTPVWYTRAPKPTRSDAKTPLAFATRDALNSIAQNLTPAPTHVTAEATLEPQSVEETQTSVPAQQTVNAIATRANAPPLAKKSNPARAISKTTNFLLLGTDTRTEDPNWQPNTDVIMVLFLDTANQRAALLSLPRDLVVAIPGQSAFRINAAYQRGWEKKGVQGGAKILSQILRDDFEIRVDHWALIDFDGLSKIIDTLGSIQVNVPCALSDTIDEQSFTIPAGEVEMDYLTAKRYVQSRYSTSDTSRNYRQQRVVWAMVKKALAINAPDRVPALYEELKQNVATDLTVFDMVGLVPAVYQLDLQNHPERLHARVLEPPAVYAWTSTSGAWLYLPNYDLIQNELETIFDAPQVAASPTQWECPRETVTPAPDSPTAAP